MPVSTKIQMRRDAAANWTSTNPTLTSGEWGLETDTRLMKIGDGSTAWNSLAYQLGPMLDEVIATDPTGAYFNGTGLVCYGVNGNYASAPDSNALDITGDIDIRIKLAMTDWTPAAGTNLIGKWTDLQKNYNLQIAASGAVAFQYTTDGTTNITRTSTAATGFTDGTTNWVRATFDVDNGAGGNDVIFYTSNDGTNWTKLGNTITNTGTVTMFSGTALLQIGAVLLGSAGPVAGTIYRAQVLNGINGTTVFDANFESVPADSFAFTESSTNAATVTLTTTRYSFGLPGKQLTGTTPAGITGNNTYYTLFTARKSITVKHLAFEVTTVPASTASVRIGIYAADAQMQPTGSILYSSDAISVSSAATAIYRIRITPTVLNPGNYVVAINSSVSFSARYSIGGSMGLVPNTLGANLNRLYAVSATLSGAALPTTGTKWNTRGTSNSGEINWVFLGWS